MINFVGRDLDQLRNKNEYVFTTRRISVCVS